MSENYYFGKWKYGGFKMWDEEGYDPPNSALPVDFPVFPSICDAGLLPPFQPQVEGVAYLIHLPSWTILTFWDRSGDPRPNSSSTFIMRGRLDFNAAVVLAKDKFQAVWKRIRFEVKEA